MFKNLLSLFYKNQDQTKFKFMLNLVTTAPPGQASEEVVSKVKSFLLKNPKEPDCYDLLVEISKREDVSPFVVALCDVSVNYERPHG